MFYLAYQRALFYVAHRRAMFNQPYINEPASCWEHGLLGVWFSLILGTNSQILGICRVDIGNRLVDIGNISCWSVVDRSACHVGSMAR